MDNHAAKKAPYMNILRRLFHPVMALIAIQLVWITLVLFWIYWFIGKHREFRELAEKYRPELLGQWKSWWKCRNREAA